MKNCEDVVFVLYLHVFVFLLIEEDPFVCYLQPPKSEHVIDVLKERVCAVTREYSQNALLFRFVIHDVKSHALV